MSVLALPGVLKTDKPITLLLDLRPSQGSEPTLSYDVGNTLITFKNLSSEICLRGMFIRAPQRFNSDDGFLFEVSEPDYSFKDFCAAPDKNSTFSTINSPQRLTQDLLTMGGWGNERFFPFDEWATPSVFLWLDARDKSGQPMNIELQIIANTMLPDWDSEVSFHPVQITVNGQKVAAYQVDTTLRRLISSRFFTALLLFLVAFVISAIPFVKDSGTAIGLILAILLGLSGLQSILIPTNIHVLTMTHLLITLLYVYLVVIAFMRFFLVPSIKRLKDNSS